MDKIISVTEYAKVRGCTPQCVTGWIRSGKPIPGAIEVKKIGDRTFIIVENISAITAPESYSNIGRPSTGHKTAIT